MQGLKVKLARFVVTSRQWIARQVSGWLFALGAGTVLGALVSQIEFFRRDPALAEAHVATWTFVLAVATILLAVFGFKSILEGQRRERRDRSAMMLGEVKAWAEQVAQAAISRQTRSSSELWSVRLKYKYALAVNAYIMAVAEPFDSLQIRLREVTGKLEEAEKVTMEDISGSTGTRLVETENELRVSIEVLLQEVAKVRYSAA